MPECRSRLRAASSGFSIFSRFFSEYDQNVKGSNRTSAKTKEATLPELAVLFGRKTRVSLFLYEGVN